MPYQALYRRRQSESDYLPRQWYLDDAEMLSWVKSGGILIKRTSALDKERLRGLIIKHNPGFIHELRNTYTILVAAGLSKEVERVVVIKELMHCYFGPDGGGIYATNSQVSLENHINKFLGSSFASHSHPAEAEAKALWMAFGVLCPEHRRQEFKQAVTSGAMDESQVAELLKIPIHHARSLLSPQFEREISSILE